MALSTCDTALRELKTFSTSRRGHGAPQSPHRVNHYAWHLRHATWSDALYAEGVSHRA